MTTLYGIPNCDTVKKARKWLDANGIEYRFHDFRKDGIDAAQIQPWLDSQGLDIVLNKRGTTWRQLPDDVKAGVTADNAAALLAEHPTLIKRPVTITGSTTLVGFKEQTYQETFGA